MTTPLDRLVDWLRQRRFRKGRIFVFWPAKDLRRDIEIFDIARLSEGVVGIRSRTYGVLRAPKEPPAFGEVTYVALADFKRLAVTHRLS